MSKAKTQKYILQELARLNEIIDAKIIKGESYRKEALRHRALLSQAKWLENDSFKLWSFGRLSLR